MKGDFSKIGFRPEQHYAQVLFQQGRVTLDADLNEQADIEAHLEETTRLDVIGQTGAPFHAPAFGFVALSGDITAGVPYGQLGLTPGRYYVNGELVECEGTAPFAVNSLSNLAVEPSPTGMYLAYLDVWHRLVTYLEDPQLREIALGGPDTAVRIKTEWQVRIEPTNFAECSDLPYPYDPAPRTLPTMLAKVTPPDPNSDPCNVPAGGGFQGLENQLYRVEIHQPTSGGGKVTFKWSRDNGSVAANITDVNGKTALLSTDGRDERTGFQQAAYIEFCLPNQDVLGTPGVLTNNIKPVGEGLVETADGTNWGADVVATKNGIARRWDGTGEVVVGKEIELEEGVTITFTGTDFRTGDYWVIPARAVIADIIWPKGVALPPSGISHGYAVLALLNKSAGKKWSLVSDCRKLFRPLSEETLFLYVGGDGQEAMPNFMLQCPLSVAVITGQWPTKNARISWTDISSTPGLLKLTDISNNPIASGVVLKTDKDGLSMIQVQLPSDWKQLDQHRFQIEARLLDGSNKPIAEPIRFGVNGSIANQVSYDPGACPSLTTPAVADTVQKALDRLKSLRRIAYVGGDGQSALWDTKDPSQILPLDVPLQVAVSSLCGPSDGDTVTFTTTGGKLADSYAKAPSGGSSFDAPVVNGVATCYWQLDGSGDPVQTVTAVLKGAEAVEVPSSVTFNATIELASNVRYTAACDNLKEAVNVQLALDKLCMVPNLLMVGGDGQEPNAQGMLPSVLVVRAMNGGGPLANAKVEFTIVGGAGRLLGDPNIHVSDTDAMGYASVAEVFQDSEVLVVRAALIGTDAQLFFTSQKVGRVRKPSLTLDEIRILGTDQVLTNGMHVRSTSLLKGIQFLFSRRIAQQTFNAGSVSFTMEMPIRINLNPGNIAGAATNVSGATTDNVNVATHLDVSHLPTIGDVRINPFTINSLLGNATLAERITATGAATTAATVGNGTTVETGGVASRDPFTIPFSFDMVLGGSYERTSTGNVFTPERYAIQLLSVLEPGAQILTRLCVKGDYVASKDDSSDSLIYLSAAGSKMAGDDARFGKYVDEDAPPGGDFTMWFFLQVSTFTVNIMPPTTEFRTNNPQTSSHKCSVQMFKAVTKDTAFQVVCDDPSIEVQIMGFIPNGQTSGNFLLMVPFRDKPSVVTITATVDGVSESVQMPITINTAPND